MAEVKADMHIHIDNEVNTNYIIKILMEAQQKNLKAISLVEHNSISAYLPNGPIYEIIKNEGLSTYFSGKLVTGFECTVVLENVPLSKNNFNYNDNLVHILCYGFDPNKLKNSSLFLYKKRYKRWLKDIKQMCKIGRKYGLEMPSYKFFEFEGIYFPKQFYYYIIKSSARKNDFIQKLSITENDLLNESVFARRLFEDAEGKFHFKFNSIPTLKEISLLIHKCGGYIFIAHPFYMNKKFLSGIDYVDALMEIPNYKKGISNIDGIEASYYKNTKEQTNELLEYAINHNLMYSGGSDSHPKSKACQSQIFDNDKSKTDSKSKNIIEIDKNQSFNIDEKLFKKLVSMGK